MEKVDNQGCSQGGDCTQQLLFMKYMMEEQSLSSIEAVTALSAMDREQLRALQVPIPEGEDQRMRMLRQTRILDTAPEETFDRFTSLAKRFFNVPISLVTLVDSSRVWFKSNLGLEDAAQAHRDIAFCSYTVLESSPDVFILRDTLEDARFQNNPLVTGAPFLRFYAGAAIKVQGMKLGSLCIMDTKPHPDFSDKDATMLKDLARLVSKTLEEKRSSTLKVEAELAKITLSVLYLVKQPLQNMNDNHSVDSVVDLQQQNQVFNALLDQALNVSRRLVDDKKTEEGKPRMIKFETSKMMKTAHRLLHKVVPSCKLDDTWQDVIEDDNPDPEALDNDVDNEGMQLYSHPELVILILVSMVSYLEHHQKQKGGGCAIDMKFELKTAFTATNIESYKDQVSQLSSSLNNSPVEYATGDVVMSFSIDQTNQIESSTNYEILGLQEVLKFVGGTLKTESKKIDTSSKMMDYKIRIPLIVQRRVEASKPATPEHSIKEDYIKKLSIPNTDDKD